ncbi:MAG: polysaccharide deacetylase family protein, partial [Pyrinomonadaceae bacterium]
MNIPILTYHSIDESGSVISTAPDVFRQQMKFLKEANWNVVSLSELACLFLNKTPLKSQTAVLTFDDGFRNFYTTAFPILEEYNFKATVFLVTDYCGKQ